MLLGAIGPVNPASVYPYYAEHGIAVDLLQKCNSQSFKWIDGYGEGWFLTTDPPPISGGTISISFVGTLDGTTKIINCYVLDRYKLDHPDHNGDFLYVLHTAEPKFELSKTAVARDYNVVERVEGTALITKAPDEVPLTLQEVIEDFTGKTVVFNVDGSFTPYDVLIHGMSKLDALDKICSAYGLLWTMDFGQLYISDNNTLGIPDYTKINDIRETMNSNGLVNVNISFPTIGECADVEDRYHNEDWTGAGQGRAFTTFHPYYYAIFDENGELTNGGFLTSLNNSLSLNYERVCLIEGFYLAKHYYEIFDFTGQPYAYKYTLADYGAGPRSIYSSGVYPHVPFWEARRRPIVPKTEIQFEILSAYEMMSGQYEGLVGANVLVTFAPCEYACLIGEEVEVIDHLRCVFDLPLEELVGIKGVAHWGVAEDASDPEALTECHWGATDRCRTESGAIVEYEILSLSTVSSGPFVGLRKARVKLQSGPLAETETDVYDHSGCIFDELDMTGYTGWAFWTTFKSLDPSDDCADSPFHWAALNRCCDPDTGIYANCVISP